MVTEFTDFNLHDEVNDGNLGDNSMLLMGDTNSMKCLKCNLLMKKI